MIFIVPIWSEIIALINTTPQVNRTRERIALQSKKHLQVNTLSDTVTYTTTLSDTIDLSVDFSDNRESKGSHGASFRHTHWNV